MKWHLVLSIYPLIALASLVEPGTSIEEVGSGYQFTEGPAADREGAVWFTDIPRQSIHRWAPGTGVSCWTTNSGGANGLYFDSSGRLVACAGERRAVIAFDPVSRAETVLADAFAGKPFNKPNDLWIAPGGGFYFSDPNYRKEPALQDHEGIYHCAPDGTLQRVIDDFKRPNGLIGTPDGKVLYATDIGAGKTWRFAIQPDGRLADRRLFCERGSDGMTLDEQGNVYLTEASVFVYRPDGTLFEEIRTPQRPANVTFGGADRRTLFITARTSVYTVRMTVRGAPGVVDSAPQAAP